MQFYLFVSRHSHHRHHRHRHRRHRHYRPSHLRRPLRLPSKKSACVSKSWRMVTNQGKRKEKKKKKEKEKEKEKEKKKKKERRMDPMERQARKKQEN